MQAASSKVPFMFWGFTCRTFLFKYTAISKYIQQYYDLGCFSHKYNLIKSVYIYTNPHGQQLHWWTTIYRERRAIPNSNANLLKGGF